MARVLENTAKQILREHSISVPDFLVATSPEQARRAAERIGAPVVLKALVPVGKRGKAGAVHFADTPAEAAKGAEDLLGTTVRFFPVQQVLVEKKQDIARELYLSITYDAATLSPVVVASAVGGMDIEELAHKYPQKMLRSPVDIDRRFYPFQAREIWSTLGLEGKLLPEAGSVTAGLFDIFLKYDCNIIEINPLAVNSDDRLCAAGVLMGVDDDALYRQPLLQSRVESGSDRAWRPLTALEKRMIAVDQQEAYRGTARYTEMEGGNIGFFCGGGGGSLLSYDALVRLGGKPANYTEFGGNPPEEKVRGLVRGVLSKQGVKGFFLNVNITNNTQTDVVARGVIGAFADLRIDPRTFPAVIRLAGVHDQAARALCSGAGLEYHGDDVTMEDAAAIMVEKMNRAYPHKDNDHGHPG